MIRPTATKPINAAASLPSSSVQVSPAAHLADGVADVIPRGLPAMTESNNPVLTRVQGLQADDARISTGSIVTTGAALLATAMTTAGCAGQGDFLFGAVVMGWCAATAGAIAGIFLGLDRLAGLMERRAIARGDWPVIENALLDENRPPNQIASMQFQVLAMSEKIPAHLQPRLFKAVVVANGDPQHAAHALAHLLAAPVEPRYILDALTGIVQFFEKNPNEFTGIFVAKALIEFEWKHNRGVPCIVLARAVDLTQDSGDIVRLIGILTTRLKLGYAQSNMNVLWAVRNLLRKGELGQEMYETDLLPYLVGVEGVDPIEHAKRRLGKSAG